MSTSTATATNEAEAAQEQQVLPPLWPGMRIPFIGVTGEYQAGKTLFGLLIDPQRTIVFDTEKSSETYEGALPFERIDMAEVMRKQHPGGDYRPVQLFEQWLKMVQSIPAGKHRVMVLDTLSEIETGLVDFVRRNPNRFGYTSAQFAKSEALMWGAAKDFWKQILTDITGRVETFIAIAHMRDKWAGNRPTGQREAKGKETIMEMASLYLELNRESVGGKAPEKPAARVIKSRLSVFVMNEATGEMEPHPVLPPRLPVCTPAAIRNYIENPPDYAKLKKAERVEERTLSDDEKLLIQREIADRTAEASRLELERAGLGNDAERRPFSTGQTFDSKESQESKPVVPVEAPNELATATNQDAEKDQDAPADVSTESAAVQMVSDGQLAEMLKLVRESGMPQAVWRGALSKFNAESAKQLCHESAERILTWLSQAIEKKKRAAELEQWAGQQVPGSGESEGGESVDSIPFQQ